jgi:hypothetical protein
VVVVGGVDARSNALEAADACRVRVRVKVRVQGFGTGS